jgi:UDP-N-acetylglucosamine 2-epimerase
MAPVTQSLAAERWAQVRVLATAQHRGDSAGVQEDAPTLCEPVLVLRSETERPESIEASVAPLVGVSHDAILEADGHASPRIVASLRRYLRVSDAGTTT